MLLDVSSTSRDMPGRLNSVIVDYHFQGLSIVMTVDHFAGSPVCAGLFCRLLMYPRPAWCSIPVHSHSYSSHKDLRS